MPCAPPKTRASLKQGKAKVVQREPFTIKPPAVGQNNHTNRKDAAPPGSE
jgi:hypothetical protein